MTGPGPARPDDLSDVATTDALLDALGTGAAVPVGELNGDAAVAGLLASWRAELDDRAATAMTKPVPVLPGSQPSRWVRAHRRTAAATALAVVLAASTSVAAAASGPSGPLGGLHKLIWGGQAEVHHVDEFAASAQAQLDIAERQIDAASQAGSISAAARSRVNGELDSADRSLARDSVAPQSLLDRLGNLRTALNGIPLAAPTPAVSDNHGQKSGSDDAPGDVRHGGSSDDGQGGGGTSGDHHSGGSGSGDGSSQGSEGGSTSGGGDSSSGDQSSGSGSQDDSSQGSGTDSGSGSDDGSGSGDGGGGGGDQSGDSNVTVTGGDSGGDSGDQSGSGYSVSGGDNSSSDSGGGDFGGD